MRKSKFNVMQIIGILRETEGDTSVKTVCASLSARDADLNAERASPAQVSQLKCLTPSATPNTLSHDHA